MRNAEMKPTKSTQPSSVKDYLSKVLYVFSFMANQSKTQTKLRNEEKREQERNYLCSISDHGFPFFLSAASALLLALLALQPSKEIWLAESHPTPESST